uniref:Cell division protein FtsL n=1 Tax=Desulfobacca acetoxidans TaxID=60893 RepID=A0A7V4LD38_9BACT
MPGNLTLRLSAAGHTLVSRNRKVRAQEHRWVHFLVWGLLSAAGAVILMFLVLSYTSHRATELNYQISQALEVQKKHLELNRQLRVEYSHLTSISRLEKLAAEYEMGPPGPGQVVQVP